MIDIKILRTQPETIRKALHDKATQVDLDRVIELDMKRVPLKQTLDNIRAERNKLSDIMSKGKPDPQLIETSKALKEQLQILEKESEQIEEEFLALYKKIPNIPTSDTPVGLSEDENVIVRKWGTLPTFNFAIKNHADIANARGWLDKERAANIAGSRFAYLK
jgi:seryl-tRNA synthetase